MRHLAHLAVAVSVAGCGSYFADDSISVVGVDKRPSGGFEQHAGRQTNAGDKYFQFGIGYKRLQAYGGNTRVAAEAISKQVMAERGYCLRGYQIHANPNLRTGTYGYSWFVECND
jgi:hypothetical protein